MNQISFKFSFTLSYIEFYVLVIFNEFLIVFKQKQIILARAPEAQNQQKVLVEEIAEIEDKKFRKINSKIFFKEKSVEEDNYLELIRDIICL